MKETEGSHPRDLLSPYLDDELSVEERSSVDRHLAACEDCRTELDALRAIARALADDDVPPPPVDLVAKIGRSLDDARKPSPRKFRYALPATIAATVGAVGILVALQWREGRIGAPSPVSPPPLPTRSAPLEPKSEPRPTDALKDVSAPAPPMVRQEQGALEKQQEGARPDSLDLRNKNANEPPPPEERDFKSKVLPEAPSAPPDESAARASKVAQGAFAGRATAAPAAKLDAASPCADHWSDSGVRGTWEVDDVAAAVRTLGQMARDVGGVGLWRGVADGRPYVLVVPRTRYEEVFYALRARNVAGLGEPPALSEGNDCTGISVAITVRTSSGSPAPR